MSIYVQHGHGKADKITSAISRGDVQGAIIAPRNEKPENLESCVTELIDAGAEEVLIDPQLYISTFAPANVRYLEDYDHFPGSLTAADFTLKRTRQLAKSMIDFQLNLGATSLIAPTVMFDSFTDRWYQIALNLADASLEYFSTINESKPLLLSFVMAEESLSAEEEINRFLDTVTQDGWSMSGLYLIVARNEGAYNQDCDSTRLTNLLYMVHVLGAINGLNVIMGYTDFLGIAFRAVGASAFASGWSQGLRQFVRKNFLKKPPGGQPPRDRYSSGPLFNSIYLQELQEIFEVGEMSRVLSGVELDRVITESQSPMASAWNLNTSQQHHWQTLHSLDSSITGKPKAELNKVLRRVREAIGIYTALEARGVEFSRFTGKQHLQNWGRGLTEFARRAGFTS